MLTADFCCAPGSSSLCCCIFTCSPRKAVESGDAKTAVVLVYLKQRLSSPLFVGLECCSGSGQVTGLHTAGNDSIGGAVTICVKGDSDAGLWSRSASLCVLEQNRCQHGTLLVSSHRQNSGSKHPTEDHDPGFSEDPTKSHWFC